jgi:hypothetical protein
MRWVTAPSWGYFRLMVKQMSNKTLLQTMSVIGLFIMLPVTLNGNLDVAAMLLFFSGMTAYVSLFEKESIPVKGDDEKEEE